jgi:hypothetical protein
MVQCRDQDWETAVKEQIGEGCVIYGYMNVNKVAGNFHFVPGKSYGGTYMHIHDITSVKALVGDLNMTHTVKKLYFGQELTLLRSDDYSSNPLGDTKTISGTVRLSLQKDKRSTSTTSKLSPQTTKSYAEKCSAPTSTRSLNTQKQSVKMVDHRFNPS